MSVLLFILALPVIVAAIAFFLAMGAAHWEEQHHVD